jgi:glycosyltransferase involved in cell wall biosynthesis
MTRVGWLADQAGYVGGAELTTAEFRAAAPEDGEIVDCPPGAIMKRCDRYVIHNCVTYTLGDLGRIKGYGGIVKYNHDVGPHLQPGVRDWLDRNARNICCSPVQAVFMGLDGAVCIPPPVDLTRFERAAENVNGDRAGAVSVGQWRNFGKAPHRAAEWGAQHGGIDFFGAGVFAPHGSEEVPYDAMPDLLAQYRTFVYLPTVIEPFGRLVAEAWAAGCEVVTNNLVGAKWWIENEPGKLDTAAQDFWRVVLS